MILPELALTTVVAVPALITTALQLQRVPSRREDQAHDAWAEPLATRDAAAPMPNAPLWSPGATPWAPPQAPIPQMGAHGDVYQAVLTAPPRTAVQAAEARAVWQAEVNRRQRRDAFSRASLELSPPPPPVAEADTKVQWLAENERRGGHDALARARDRPAAERSRSAALPAEHEAWRSEVARRHSRDADARAQGRLSEEPRHEGGRTRDGAKEAWRSEAWFAEVERRSSRDATTRARRRPPAF
ncbi:hypothetical protein EMIHUDRAFT_197211 [Emiliania huxleyi CCMP1516]|uniref:Uncharacterized protein n=2 Tax=Emiliania huxleyi TaxID=2903 RepID=A0A0D3ITW3_EMIH1|nr:hypothetical protein EMIHUDRAFT_197211 [Emiliania huxleyi CCMP1516]EOD14698.1 hypothetical protein EMIHUDRAFT_197211 [Emiliania huxleyi CCMP1516]|eukprot:XP_005767127.1 hypothetical protein EMIHUDRAFT_197211 [Emiliania huxleyi CCMP1516]